MPCFAIPSLLAWLKAKADVLETLQTSIWTKDIDECFSAVYLSKTLTSVKAMPRSKANVEVLARFKTLQACYLTCSVQDFDLALLQGLEQLTSLDLAVGTFANLDASRLTYLGLLDAEATLTAGCSKLIKLSMVRSALDERALLACTALRYLHIARCSIPLDMSSLAALRVVEFEARVFTYYAELQCICTLPSVSHLDLLLPSSLPFFSGAITAGSAFENLTKVTYLSLRTTHSSKCLQIPFDLSALKGLVCLHIDRGFLAKEELLHMSQLHHLQHVSLELMCPTDAKLVLCMHSFCCL